MTQTVQLIAFPGAPNLPIFVAQEKGWFAKHDVELAITMTPSSAYQAEALAKGGKDKEKIRAALEGLKNFKGAGGDFSFSPTSHSGLGKDDAVVINWKNNGWRLAPY